MENKEEKNKPVAESTEKQDKKLYAILAYLGILIIIPFMVAKEDPFVKFHIKQGVLLLILWVGLFLVLTLPIVGHSIYTIGSLVLLIFIVIGIANVLGEKKNELPLIGHLAKKFDL